MDVDWGIDEDPTSFWSLGACHPVEGEQPEDLPEVQAAIEQGWAPVSEAPLWCFVPAIWPPAHRTWVRDQRARHSTWSDDAGNSGVVPWSSWDHVEIEADYNRLLVECGLPPRPPGRVWLLRPPPGCSSADDLLLDAWDGWLASGGVGMATAGLVSYVAAHVRRTFETGA